MIIEGLLNMIIGLFESVLGFIHIPQIDSGIVEAAHNTFSSMVEYANNSVRLCFTVYRLFSIVRTIADINTFIAGFI